MARSYTRRPAYRRPARTYRRVPHRTRRKQKPSLSLTAFVIVLGLFALIALMLVSAH